MPCQGSQRGAWLRLVPEPERCCRSRSRPCARGLAACPESVRRERERLESVVLNGTARDWLRYLSDAAALALRPSPPELGPAALTVAEVVRDHHRLLQGLSPWLAARTRRERLALEERVRSLRAEPTWHDRCADLDRASTRTRVTPAGAAPARPPATARTRRTCMKLTVDPALCQGYGLCADEAPELVELDDAGYATMLGDGEVADELQLGGREGGRDVSRQGAEPALTPPAPLPRAPPVCLTD